MSPEEIDRMLRPVQLKDLRLMCRARGLNPAGEAVVGASTDGSDRHGRGVRGPSLPLVVQQHRHGGRHSAHTHILRPTNNKHTPQAARSRCPTASSSTCSRQATSRAPSRRRAAPWTGRRWWPRRATSNTHRPVRCACAWRSSVCVPLRLGWGPSRCTAGLRWPLHGHALLSRPPHAAFVCAADASHF